jgi:ribosomal protein L32
MSTNLVHLPLRQAFLCENCQHVGNSGRVCPACGDKTALISLAGVLNREQTITTSVRPEFRSMYLKGNWAV